MFRMPRKLSWGGEADLECESATADCFRFPAATGRELPSLAIRDLLNTDLQPTPAEQREIEAIVRHFGGAEGRARIYDFIDGQLNVLHTRAQSLIQIAGVVITVTGFSGRIIADTSKSAQTLIVSGVALVSIAAAIALMFVMPIRWLSSYLHLPMEEWLLTALRRRRKKNRAFRVASIIIVAGMILYVSAVAMMLLHPEVTELKQVR